MDYSENVSGVFGVITIFSNAYSWFYIQYN